MADKQSKSFWKVFLNGLIVENPTFVLMLGMCPTLGVTTAAINGIGMGLATTVVLMCSNLLISLLRNIISERIRIPAFIVVIASFVSIIEMLLKAYLPSLSDAPEPADRRLQPLALAQRPRRTLDLQRFGLGERRAAACHENTPASFLPPVRPAQKHTEEPDSVAPDPTDHP